MPQVRRDVPLSFGDPKKTFNGFVLVNTENGDMEWYSNSFPGTPTFQSNASNGFKWEPNSDSSINNLAGTFGNKQKTSQKTWKFNFLILIVNSYKILII